MRPDGIQDESSEHELRKAHSSSIPECYNIAQVIERVMRQNQASRKRKDRATRKRKWPSTARTGEPLSHASLAALVDVWNRLDNAVEDYEKSNSAAENSPSRTLRLFKGKAFLEFIKGSLEEYLITDKEQDTDALLVSLEELLDRASKQHRIGGHIRAQHRAFWV